MATAIDARIDSLLSVARSLVPTGGQQKARKERDYYEGRQVEYVQPNPDEDLEAFQRRPRLTLNITAAAVDLLGSLYSRPQRRSWGGGRLYDLLRETFDASELETLLAEADRLSHLSGLALLQPYWDSEAGIVRVRLLPRDAVEVLPSLQDARRAAAVMVSDFWHQDREARWAVVWTADQTFVFDGSPEPVIDVNPYGVLPFVAVRYRPAVDRFDRPGIGEHIVPANEQLNKLLTELAHGVIHQAWPQRWARNVQPGWRPVLGPATFIEIEGDGEVGQLSPDIPAGEIWRGWIEPLITWHLAVVGIPASVILRQPNTEVRSGVQIVAMQGPIYAHQAERIPMFARVERELLWLCARLYETHLGVAAPPSPKELEYSVHFDAPRSPVLTFDVYQEWQWLIDRGLMSIVDAYLALHPGLTREEAERQLEEIARENERFAAAMAPRTDDVNA